MPGHDALFELESSAKTKFGGIAIAVFNGAPTASISGYATGCLAVGLGGDIDNTLYINTGTVATATWSRLNLTAF